ncbi:MAG: Hsp20/alpha crystallin family protein [Saprospiraceae bacterium]
MKLVKVNPRRRNYPSTVVNFDNLFNEFFNTGFPQAKMNTANNPALNVVELESGYRLELAVPGFNKDSINIEVDQDILSIAGKLETEAKEGEKYTRREFRYGAFKRTFHLPETVDANTINAQFENGVLLITLGLKEEAKPEPARQIEIA